MLNHIPGGITSRSFSVGSQSLSAPSALFGNSAPSFQQTPNGLVAQPIGGSRPPFVASASQIAGVSQFNGQPIVKSSSYSYMPAYLPPGQSSYDDKPYQSTGLSSTTTTNYGQPAAVQTRTSYSSMNMGNSAYGGSSSGATGGMSVTTNTANVNPDPQRPSTSGTLTTTTTIGMSNTPQTYELTYEESSIPAELDPCIDNPLFPVGTLTPPPGFTVGLQGGYEYGFLATAEWESNITKIGSNFDPSKMFYQYTDLPDDVSWFRGGCPVGSLQIDEAIINGLDYRLCRGSYLPDGAAYTIGYENSNTVFQGASCSIVACGSSISYSQCLQVATRYYAHWVYCWQYLPAPLRASPSLMVLVTTSEQNPFNIYSDQPYDANPVAPFVLAEVAPSFTGVVVSQYYLNTTLGVTSPFPNQVTITNGGRTYYGFQEVFPQTPGWNSPFRARVDFSYSNSANLGFSGESTTRTLVPQAGVASMFTVRQEWANPVADFFGSLGAAYVFDINNNIFKPSFGLVIGLSQTVTESCTSTYRPSVQSTWDNSQMQQSLLAYGYVRNTAPTYSA